MFWVTAALFPAKHPELCNSTSLVHCIGNIFSHSRYCCHVKQAEGTKRTRFSTSAPQLTNQPGLWYSCKNRATSRGKVYDLKPKMRISLVVFLLGLAVCFAAEDVPMVLVDKYDPSSSEEISDPIDIAHKQSTAPSFEDIKKELEDNGILDNPVVLGLFRRGEEPVSEDETESDEDNESSVFKRAALIYRHSLCKTKSKLPLRHYIGGHATLLIRNFGCPNTRCWKCGGKPHGYCKLDHTHLSIRFLVYHKKWYWVWKSFLIPGCCRCFKNVHSHG